MVMVMVTASLAPTSLNPCYSTPTTLFLHLLPSHHNLLLSTFHNPPPPYARSCCPSSIKPEFVFRIPNPNPNSNSNSFCIWNITTTTTTSTSTSSPPRFFPNKSNYLSSSSSFSYSSSLSATSSTSRATKTKSPPPPSLHPTCHDNFDRDSISLLNERILREHSKRDSRSAPLMDPQEADKYLQLVKEQQERGLQKLKGGGGADHPLFGYKVDPYTLRPGDYVVHKKVGIGRFVAIKFDIPKDSSIFTHHRPIEYVFIDYADGMAKLPVKQASRMLYRYNLYVFSFSLYINTSYIPMSPTNVLALPKSFHSYFICYPVLKKMLRL